MRRLTEKQHGVLKGMVFGMIIAISIVGLGSYLNPFGYQEPISLVSKLNILAVSLIIPTFFLAIAIGRLAKHRFFTAEDIDGGGMSRGSEQAKVLQALLQNTVEQTLLASLIYGAWLIVMPAKFLSTVPLAALAFGLGRILFFVGYNSGAPSRALGFTLSFYPSMVMFIGIVGNQIGQLVS
ncbi:MAPEG family protein [Arenicella xantha]|uniref:MAPEG family protein n=1 Tax=Arenicella xantha TaxID=644221 RepID=A0A395JQ72_9GAMM|nr:MAPEG family protein [Arenicella xantha]RBP53667.1 MAPEG family protein [Arenicella xantha]